MDEGEKKLRCVVVTPERAVFDEAADYVAIPMYDGELGVLPGRAPLIGRLGCGELRVVQGRRTRRFFVDGGFAQIRDNVVTLLTARAMPAEAITVRSAEEALHQAQTATMPPEDRLKAEARARAQLRIARKTHEEVHA